MSQPPSSTSTHHGSREDDYDRNERLLRDFDMNLKYGPLHGLTRKERYERAVLEGRHPPEIIGQLLSSGRHWAGHPGHAGK